MSLSRTFLLLASFCLTALGLAAQTVTIRGDQKSVQVPVVVEPFPVLPSPATSVPTPIVPQPSLQKELDETIPAANINQSQAATTFEQSLTSPGAVLGGVFIGPNDGGNIPPDAGIAAGPNHLVIAINKEIVIYNKAGGRLLSSPFGIFFSALPFSNGCCFDPRILYDSFHGRFILTAAENHGSSDSHVFIAVSQTSDPTGNWFKYELNTQVPSPQGTPTFTDFPTLGVSSSAIYIGGNQLGGTETTWLWVVQLAGLLTGNSTLNVTSFPSIKLPNGKLAFTIQPAIMYGDPGVAYLASTDSNPQVGGNTVHLFSIPTTGTPTLTIKEVPVAPYSPVAGAPQPNSTTQLTALGDIMVSSPVWRNGSLWVTHAVANGSAPAVRWYQILTSSATVRQSGTITGAGAAFLPSITASQTGAADIVFATSSSSQFASAAFAHREPTAPLGQMPVQAIYENGLVTYTIGGGRWGDYTAISADPSGTSSWAYSEYAANNTTYGTSVAHLLSSPPKPPSCTTTTIGVKICKPAAGATVTSPVQISAAALGHHRIISMKAFVSGKQVASSASGTLNAKVNVTKGSHTLTVNARDSAGVLYQKRETFTVH